MATPRTRTKAYKPVRLVEVHLWGMHIGSVALDPGYGYYAFSYTPDFAGLGIEPSPLHMPVVPDQVYLFTDLPELTYKRLPALLNDALPDDFGNALINRYMSDQGIAAASVTPLDRLAYMSTRAMGAMSFKPARGPATQKSTAIVLSQLVEQARLAVTGQVDNDDPFPVAQRAVLPLPTRHPS